MLCPQSIVELHGHGLVSLVYKIYSMGFFGQIYENLHQQNFHEVILVSLVS